MGPFVDALGTLTGTPQLMSDPHQWGGGQHQISPGGRLDVHADFQIHPVYGTTRRVNVLVYLNERWESDWGGSLELWDADGPVRRILPALNTMVVFDTSSTSFHGHPDPVASPPGTTRKSVALYYYTAEGRSQAMHSTTEWHLKSPGAGSWHLPTREARRDARGHLRKAVRAMLPQRW